MDDLTAEKDLAIKKFVSTLTQHLYDQSEFNYDVAEVSKELHEHIRDEENALNTLQCSHCNHVVPGLYWTEMNMVWRCPICNLQHTENDGVRL